MRVLIYCLLAMLWPAGNSYAQSPPADIRPLGIGDTVPDMEITNVYNYPVSKIRLSDLKGKLVIPDFWATCCGACIETLPKIQELQEKFDDQLQVILINTFKGDDIKKVSAFFDRREKLTGHKVTLPFSLLQNQLDSYFPGRFIPHYVWISKNSIVSAITSATEITSSNIKKII